MSASLRMCVAGQWSMQATKCGHLNLLIADTCIVYLLVLIICVYHCLQLELIPFNVFLMRCLSMRISFLYKEKHHVLDLLNDTVTALKAIFIVTIFNVSCYKPDLGALSPGRPFTGYL